MSGKPEDLDIWFNDAYDVWIVDRFYPDGKAMSRWPLAFCDKELAEAVRETIIRYYNTKAGVA